MRNEGMRRAAETTVIALKACPHMVLFAYVCFFLGPYLSVEQQMQMQKKRTLSTQCVRRQ